MAAYIDTSSMMGASNLSTAELLGKLGSVAQGGLHAVGNDLKIKAFEQALDSGADTLVQTAKQMGVDNPEQFKAYGTDRQTLALGYQALMKKVESKKQQESRMAGIGAALEPVVDGKTDMFSAGLGPISPETMDSIGIPQSGEIIETRESTFNDAIKRPEVQKLIASGDIDTIKSLFSGEGKPLNAYQEELLKIMKDREDRHAEGEERRKTKQELDRRGDILKILKLDKNTPDIMSSFRGLSEELESQYPVIAKIDAALSKSGITASTIQKAIPQLLMNLAAKNNVVISPEDRKALVDMEASKMRFLADYIKDISGAQASDREVVRLTAGVAAGAFHTMDDFMRQASRLLNKRILSLRESERAAAGKDPLGYKEFLADYGNPPSKMIERSRDKILQTFNLDPQDTALSIESEDLINKAISGGKALGSKIVDKAGSLIDYTTAPTSLPELPSPDRTIINEDDFWGAQ